MSPHGPIETKPKPITSEDVREWFEGAVARHSKLERLNLDAAYTEFVSIAVLSNFLKAQGRVPLEGWHKAAHEIQKAVAVLVTTLPYLERTSEYPGTEGPDFYALLKAAKQVNKYIGNPRGRGQNAPHLWHEWVKALAPLICQALVAAGHKRVSLTSDEAPFVAVLYGAIPAIAGDSVEVGHSAIAEFFKKNRRQLLAAK